MAPEEIGPGGTVTTQTVIDQRAPFGVHTAVVGADLILRPEGELDLAWVHLLDAVMPHESDIMARVTIDMGGLDFVDTAGVRALLRVRSAHERRGRDVRIINARPLARRILALLSGPPAGSARAETDTLQVTPGYAGGYGELTARIRDLGLLRPKAWSYARTFALVIGGLVAVVTVMLLFQRSWWLLLLAPALGVIATQIGFLGHDVGHLQVTRSQARSRILGLVDGNLLGGLSYGWWIAKHNAHHAHPNDLEHDPDVRSGVLVFDAAQATERRGIGGWTTRHQAVLFFPFLLGEAVNLHVSSIRRLFSPGLRRPVAEALLLGTHFVAYIALLATTLTWLQALLFVAIHKGVQGIYLGCSFAPNHKGMPTLDTNQAADPLLRQVLTSRNVRGGPFIDAALGGLNYQIEHHLFPSMPRANLRHAQPVVQKFCNDRGIPYAQCSVIDSYTAALRHLQEVGGELRLSDAGSNSITK